MKSSCISLQSTDSFDHAIWLCAAYPLLPSRGWCGKDGSNASGVAYTHCQIEQSRSTALWQRWHANIQMSSSACFLHYVSMTLRLSRRSKSGSEFPIRRARRRLTIPHYESCASQAKHLNLGVEAHVIDGVPVRVTRVARTVADCFKFRSKVGLDVALEALREAWRTKRVSMDDLWRDATLCR